MADAVVDSYQDTEKAPVQPRNPSTPVANKVSGQAYIPWEGFSKRVGHREINREMIRNELDTHIAQIPMDEFLNQFVPPKLKPEDEEIAIDAVRRKTVVDSRLLKAKGPESERYLPLMKLLEPSWEGTDIVARNVSRWGPKKPHSKITPDIVAYRCDPNRKTPHDIPKEEQHSSKSKKAAASNSTVCTPSIPDAGPSTVTAADSAASSSSLDPASGSIPVDRGVSSSSSPNPLIKEPSDYVARMNYHDVQLFLEDKVDNDSAPFQKKPKDDFLLDNDRSKASRGQIGEYAAEILRQQHRCYLFSIVTVHNTVRFLRWDRSGVIMSEPVDFSTDSGLKIFITFLYRFGRMTLRERGTDTTVMDPNAEDLKQLQEFKTSKLQHIPLSHQEFFSEAFDDKEEANWPLRAIELEPFHCQDTKENSTNPSDKKIRLLIRAPKVSTRSPFGRATRGFVALDVDELKLKFLKDAWRYDGGTYNAELDVYKRLYKHKVKNIATVEGGGDVPDPDPQVAESKWQAQKTTAHKYLKTDGIAHLSQAHHRLLIRQLGTPLEKYYSSRHLCYYLLRIIDGHCSAWTEAGVLHRDISPNNMLFCEDPEDMKDLPSFLVDWDLCKYKEQLNNGPSQKTRSGTWAFISALLLRYPTKQHELSDDLESFVHVLQWFCLRFHTHDMSSRPADIAEKLTTVYLKAAQDEQGFEECAKLKLEYMQNGNRYFSLIPGQVAEGLQTIITKMSDLCKKHYATVDINALEKARIELLEKAKANGQSAQAQPSTSNTTKKPQAIPALIGLVENPKPRPIASSTPKSSLISPFLTHAELRDTIDITVTDTPQWVMPTPSRNLEAYFTDKLPDQFTDAIYKMLSMHGPKIHSMSQSSTTGSKRSSSAANLESLVLPNSKRSRTSGDQGEQLETRSQSSAAHGTLSLPATVIEEDDVFT
ncbi:hypothetical protein ABKN59_005688 [Abortiporus biennis]